MPANLARYIVNHRRIVLVLGLVFVAVAGALGGNVAEKLSNGGFEDPNAESTQAKVLVENRFGGGTPNLVLLVSAADGATVDSPATQRAALALTSELAAEPGITSVASYWSLQAPPLRSTNGRQALVLARIAGSENTVSDRIKELSPKYNRNPAGGLHVEVTGEAEVFRQVGETIQNDLARAELIALPLTLLLLIIVFGGVVSASLPLVVGVFTVMATFLTLSVLTNFLEVSIFALNLTTALGLGLAIDYALFIVSRYREELQEGWAPTDAVVRTVRTAGRTVVFSAATVAISLSALLVFRQSFLRSFAYAGIAVAIMAALASVVVLPALLALLGTRVNSLRLFKLKTPKAGETGLWHRIAMAVMRRPGRIAISVSALLLVLGLPFLHIELGLSDHRVLPKDASARVALDELAKGFTSRESAALTVVLPDGKIDVAQRSAYAASISKVTGVARVDTLDGSFAAGRLVAPANPASQRFAEPTGGPGTWFSVVPSIEPVSPAGERLAKSIRAVAPPSGTKRLVGGPSAELVDTKASLFERLPLAVSIIAGVTFIVLFLMFGGLLVPLKAVLLNMLSLSATFGAMVWIFQDGNLSGALNFTPTNTLDATTPILMFCIAFGLSMDYEVFLLSRIKEEHDRGADNTRAVAMGLERTGRIVTAAAVLIAVVFIAFATSGITFIKLFGLGLALAVLMDAFLIRATLVPAFMRLAGEANWWAPGPLRRFQERFGISEHVDLEAYPTTTNAASKTNGATVTVVTELVDSRS